MSNPHPSDPQQLDHQWNPHVSTSATPLNSQIYTVELPLRSVDTTEESRKLRNRTSVRELHESRSDSPEL